MKASGEFTYSLGNKGSEMHTLADKIDGWSGGYVGVMSFCTEARFSNISFQDRYDHSNDGPEAGPTPTSVALKDNFKTNLTDLTAYGGTWEVRENGLYSNAVDQGNCWLYAKNSGTNFVYSTDVTFLKDQGAATLLFRSADGKGFEDCYAMNIDVASQECKMWRQELVVEDDQSGSFDVQLMDVRPVSKSAKVAVTGPDGKSYAEGKNIPVPVGKNYVTITITDTNEDGVQASATYRVNVHRRQADSVYYNEPYRGQYHYSVKDGWGNDPNGMVYYKGVWHLYHQFDDDPSHRNQVHWLHATSTDLIHWEEQPTALYPDAYGAMFSGCAVVDEQTQSQEWNFRLVSSLPL